MSVFILASIIFTFYGLSNSQQLVSGMSVVNDKSWIHIIYSGLCQTEACAKLWWGAVGAMISNKNEAAVVAYLQLNSTVTVLYRQERGWDSGQCSELTEQCGISARGDAEWNADPGHDKTDLL